MCKKEIENLKKIIIHKQFTIKSTNTFLIYKRNNKLFHIFHKFKYTPERKINHRPVDYVENKKIKKITYDVKH